MADSVKASVFEETNVIEVTARSTDPDKAANKLAEGFAAATLAKTMADDLCSTGCPDRLDRQEPASEPSGRSRHRFGEPHCGSRLRPHSRPCEPFATPAPIPP